MKDEGKRLDRLRERLKPGLESRGTLEGERVRVENAKMGAVHVIAEADGKCPRWIFSVDFDVISLDHYVSIELEGSIDLYAAARGRELFDAWPKAERAREDGYDDSECAAMVGSIILDAVRPEFQKQLARLQTEARAIRRRLLIDVITQNAAEVSLDDLNKAARDGDAKTG